jgi:predicted HicB family RNase H-like nuclease
VRLPCSLHRRLVERAQVKGISLNQLVNVALAEAICKA